MQKLIKDLMARLTNHETPSARLCLKGLWIFLLSGIMMLTACGGGSSPSADLQQSATLSGNWQFSMTSPDPAYHSGFQYGLQGGFLLQNNSVVTGQAVYSVAGAVNPNGTWAVCNSGTATVTGTISNRTVSLTAVAGTLSSTPPTGQTYTLTNGTLSADGLTISGGTFTVTEGQAIASDGITIVPCGLAGTSSLSATSVPPLTGSITGSFHSTGLTLGNQDFPVTGFLTQGENIGASSATVTGTLNFLDPTTLLTDYSCFPTGLVSVNGQISGNTAILSLIGTDGSNDGQIGVSPSQPAPPLSTVLFQPAAVGVSNQNYILHSLGTDTLGSAPAGTAYVVNTKVCPNRGSPLTNPGDFGYICLALNSTSACQQPILVTPASITFGPQLLGATPPSQTITLMLASGVQEVDNLTLKFFPFTGTPGSGQSDFNGRANLTETDTCGDGDAAASGSTFSLGGKAPPSCTITIAFSPQESCTWLPTAGGTPPVQCPSPLTATLTVNSSASADSDKSFLVPITGTGLSFIQPSFPELDFGAQAPGEASLPQLLSFTNYSANPVQILPQSNNCTSPLPRPLQIGSTVSGLQVVNGSALLPPSSLLCDIDPNSHQPNFQISSDTCTGTTLAAGATCSLEVAFVPQPAYLPQNQPLDYFLELNTVQCTNAANEPLSPAGCEVDSGRFPVELRANAPSPLRMSPSAGLNFGNVSVGKSSVVQTVTLRNDLNLAQTVNFIGKVAVSGHYTEKDDCLSSLAPGGQCTLTITFKPAGVGFNPGTLTIDYSTSPNSFNTQTVYLRGTGQ